jgi:hypothetical protein
MIFFGRYGHVEDIKTDKKILLGHFNSLNHSLDYDDKKEYNEKEIVDVVKINLKKYIKDSTYNLKTDNFSYFLISMGLSYYILSPEEKKEILEMDYTYDNWKIKSQELIDSFDIRIKNAFPENLRFCLEDEFFVLHIRICYERDFKINDFIFYFNHAYY